MDAATDLQTLNEIEEKRRCEREPPPHCQAVDRSWNYLRFGLSSCRIWLLLVDIRPLLPRN